MFFPLVSLGSLYYLHRSLYIAEGALTRLVLKSIPLSLVNQLSTQGSLCYLS